MIITEQSKLDYKMGYMVVRGMETKRILLDEIAILVIENPMISITGCLLAELSEKKVKVIFCDNKRSPISELVPYHGSHDSSAKIRAQMTWGKEIEEIVWQEIISEKIHKQVEMLQLINRHDEAALLLTYIAQVQPWDETNREGHAAKVYFNALFGMSFTRSADIPVNAALNYGYSLILSTFNREIAANGYLSQIGIFHDNMFNPFNLSCDLMEPFRILVDRFVYYMAPERFEKEEKHELWKILQTEVMINGERQLVINAIRIYCKSIFEAINDRDISQILFYQFI